MSQPSNHLEEMRLVSFCPVCETRSNPMHARTLGQEGETRLLHIQCQKCHNAFLALVLVNQVGASSIGLLTDLSFEDVVRFHENASISVNDVISAHECLENVSWVSKLGKSSMAPVSVPKKRVATVKVATKRSKKS